MRRGLLDYDLSVLNVCPMSGEPTPTAPKSMHPLPMWLTHFEDYEDELLPEFCPPSAISSPQNSNFPAPIMAKRHSGRMSTSGHNLAFERSEEHTSELQSLV